MSLSPETINNYLRSRRSVFVDQFEPGIKIPDEVILEILRNANCAPTHKLTEPWRFVVFSEGGLKTFAETQAAIYKEEAGSSYKQNKHDKLLATPLNCSHVIALCMKRHDGIPEVEELAAVSCAVQNIYLSLLPYGVGGYWSTGGITYMEGAKKFLELGENDRLLGFFFLGYIKTPTAHRTPGAVEEKIKWVK